MYNITLVCTSPEEELSIEVWQVNGVHVNAVDLAES